MCCVARTTASAGGISKERDVSDIIDDELWDMRRRVKGRDFYGRWKWSKKRGCMIWKWKARKVKKGKA
jgi:hypothetical protein